MRREHGSRVISLDPNIRPGFITDPAAPGPHRPDDRHERYPEDVGRGSRMVWLPDMETAAGSGSIRAPAWCVYPRRQRGAIGFTRDHKVEVDGRRSRLPTPWALAIPSTPVFWRLSSVTGLLTKQAIKTLSADAIGNALRLGARPPPSPSRGPAQIRHGPVKSVSDRAVRRRRASSGWFQPA
jgi:fructokinase